MALLNSLQGDFAETLLGEIFQRMPPFPALCFRDFSDALTLISLL